METIGQRVIGALAKLQGINKSNMSIDADFFFDLEMDSLDRVEALTLLEQEFGMTIPLADAAKFSRVRDVVDYLTPHLGGA
ncbi:acyl carrier protein [Serratia rhizosphaerae]|uniref:acyl carrier protein n=1 Tax=Serratia rhizosphaerae TaxID=2597702 RepID=UPI002DB92869|nr:phosphopantetheine-binding protein [Serratia rhizosphaerae]MEB6336106.1 acyl carrier protein [Serratia rhizosphaerae]